MVLPSDGDFTARPQPPRDACSVLLGNWRSDTSRRGGPRSGRLLTQPKDAASIDWAATLRVAAPLQLARGRGDADRRLILRPADLRFRQPRGPAGCLLFFVVDASGSMAAWRRMQQTKAAILALLSQAYQHRDRVALLTFRGDGATLVLPPVRGLAQPRGTIESLPVGGATPLALGLAAARDFLHRQQRRRPDQRVWTVLFTDGRANVATSGNPWRDALTEARFLATCATDVLVVDTETGWTRFGRAHELAQTLGARCMSVEDVLGRRLSITA